VHKVYQLGSLVMSEGLLCDTCLDESDHDSPRFEIERYTEPLRGEHILVMLTEVEGGGKWLSMSRHIILCSPTTAEDIACCSTRVEDRLALNPKELDAFAMFLSEELGRGVSNADTHS